MSMAGSDERSEEMAKLKEGVKHTRALLYMMFDGTYVAKSLDLAPRGATFDDQHRLVGKVCEFQGEDDGSMTVFRSNVTNMKDAVYQHADQSKLASEVLEFFVHHASQLHHLPRLTFATVAKAWGGFGPCGPLAQGPKLP